MGSKKKYRARIENAATDVANKDYPHFKAAVQHATEYTALGPYTFGMAPSTVLLPRYVAAHNTQVQNLEDGLQKFEEAIRGLAEVAGRSGTTTHVMHSMNGCATSRRKLVRHPRKRLTPRGYSA